MAGGCGATGGGYNISTMGTLTQGPTYSPMQWRRHEGHPGWTINMVGEYLVGLFSLSLMQYTAGSPHAILTVDIECVWRADNILDTSLATSRTPPDLITIHLGTNDCDGGVNITTMKVLGGGGGGFWFEGFFGGSGGKRCQ